MCADTGVSLNRLLPAIQRNDALKMSAGEAEIERIEHEQGILHFQMRGHVFQRQSPAAHKGSGVQRHVN